MASYAFHFRLCATPKETCNERSDDCVDYLLIDFNGYIELESESAYFDYKTRFKNQSAIRHLTEDVLRNHRRALRTHPEIAFAIPEG